MADSAGFRLADQEYDPAIPVDALSEHPANYNKGNDGALVRAMEQHGFYGGVIVQKSTRQIIAGNTRYRAALARGAMTLPGFWLDVSDDEAEELLAWDNYSSRLAVFDEARLVELLVRRRDSPRGLEPTGYADETLNDLIRLVDGQKDNRDVPRPTLADRFLVPPFSVLDARQGWWQDRKRAWLALGIRSELGRDAIAYNNREQNKNLRSQSRTGRGLGYSDQARDPSHYSKQRRGLYGKGATGTDDYRRPGEHAPDKGYTSGISVFDPVLCELVYRWFSPPGGLVIDPFAGGSVRGIVAAALGRSYEGCDLSAVQIDADRQQVTEILGQPVTAAYHAGDSRTWVETLPPASADLIFTCPPYAWLERYSDDPADLSTMTEAGFGEALTAILTGAARVLRDDRFAAIVIGDAREPRSGRLADLRGLVIASAAAAGLTLHVAAILVTAVGSLPVRTARAFEASRILGRTHQDVLIFCKGDRSRAAQACGPVDVALPDALADGEDIAGEQELPGVPGTDV